MKRDSTIGITLNGVANSCGRSRSIDRLRGDARGKNGGKTVEGRVYKGNDGADETRHEVAHDGYRFDERRDEPKGREKGAEVKGREKWHG